MTVFAGVACAALMGLAQPAFAANPGVPHHSASPVAAAVAGFYAHRANAPLWLKGGRASPAAASFLDILDRAGLDGLASGPDLAARARSLITRASGGDAAAGIEAEQLLSSALILYAQAIHTPPPGVTYADSWVTPRRLSPGQILATAGAAPSLASHVAALSAVNPVYDGLRAAAFAEKNVTGAVPDARVAENLARVRHAPFQDRYIMVDAASATLWMIENGQVADSMKVIVGKEGARTPMVASTIYRATLNPYWNVPGDLVQKLIAPRVIEQGAAYLKERNYELLDGPGGGAQPLDPRKVDWKKVAAGTSSVRVRQLPGPANSMGQVKFGFPNASDIFLHDTPNKELFDEASRDLSNGCIRLSDAPRLARWLLGRDSAAATGDPEQHVLLPTPVPIYVTYLTAQVKDGRIAFIDDVDDRDHPAAVASLR